MNLDDRRRWDTWAALLAIVVMIPLGTVWATAASARSRMADCRNNLRQLGAAFAAYSTRYGSYPEPGTVTWFGSLWTSRCVDDPGLFRCPVRGRSGTGCHYQGISGERDWWAPGSPKATWMPGRGRSFEAAPPDLPLACDETWPSANHGVGGNVNALFLDGHVEEVPHGSARRWAIDDFLGPETGWAAPAGTR